MNRRQLIRLLGSAAVLLGGCGGKTVEPAVVAGRPMPPLALPDLAGNLVRIGEGSGPLLLNFWATWCPPCRAEMGGLDRLYRRWRSAGLSMFGISIDDDANLVREFVLKNGIGFPILLDRSGVLAQGSLALRSFPTTVLVGRNGLVAELVIGERAWDVSPAQDAVRALLG